MEHPNQADIQVAIQDRLPEATLEHHHHFQGNKQQLRRSSEHRNRAIRVNSRAIHRNPVSSPCQDIHHSRDNRQELQDIHRSQVAAIQASQDVLDLINLPCQEQGTCISRHLSHVAWIPTKCRIRSR